jgi:hypothetical protein
VEEWFANALLSHAIEKLARRVRVVEKKGGGGVGGQLS